MEAVFTFPDTHAAVNGERLLLNCGVKVKVMALPSSLGAGCGLCLRVAAGELDCSRRLLDESSLSPQGVYLKKMDKGKTIYVPLAD